jgi:hypothetical protein
MEKKEFASTEPLNASVWVVNGERLGWVDQLGYIHAFLPTAWVTPYGDLIGYVGSHGTVRLWGQRNKN